MQHLILSALFLYNVQNILTPSRVTGVHSTNNERIRFLTVSWKMYNCNVYTNLFGISKISVVACKYNPNFQLILDASTVLMIIQ